MKYKIFVISLLFVLTSCNTQADVPTPTSTLISTETPVSTPTVSPTETAIPTASALPTETPVPSEVFIEFDSAGKKVEMRSFGDDGNAALDFIIQETLLLNEEEISRMTAGTTWLTERGAGTQADQLVDLFKGLRNIDGFQSIDDLSFPFDDVGNNSESFFQLFRAKVEQPDNDRSGTILVFRNMEGTYVPAFTNLDIASIDAIISGKALPVSASE